MSRLTLGKFQIAYHSKHWPVCRKRHPSQPLQNPSPCKQHSSRKPSSFSINLGLLLLLKFSVLALLLETNWLVLCSGQTAAHSLSSQHKIENRGKKVWNSRHWAIVQIDFESHAFTTLKHKQNHHYDLVSQVHFLRKVFSPLKFTPII